MDNNNNYNSSYTSEYKEYDKTPSQDPVPVTDWLLTIFLTGIPCVGIILLFLWAFSGKDYDYKTNYSKAVLLLGLAGIVVGFLLTILGGIVGIMSY